MKISLIANTGIQFSSSEFEVKAGDSFTDKTGNMMFPVSIQDENGYTYPLAFYETFVPMKGLWLLEPVVNFSDDRCVRLSDLKRHTIPFPYIYADPQGNRRIVSEDRIDFTMLNMVDADDCYSDYCLAGSIMSHLHHGTCPLDCIENRWLPMPVFEKDSMGGCLFGPTSWARVKLVPVSNVRNLRKYKAVWAFDTDSVRANTSGARPYFFSGEREKHYSLCDDVPTLLDYFSKDLSCGWVDEYIVSLIHGSADNAVIENPETGISSHFRYIAYYITLVSYLSKIGACPDITLYSDDLGVKNVDLVLDIGNSRTCGVLFENSDFTKVEMLTLRDLTEPWKSYCKPFDMRLAFHHAQFGDFDTDTDQFDWKSFVRVGDEATKLIYQARPSDGVSEKTTNYSSPKRYLWDDRQFQGQWDFLVTEDEECQGLNKYINIKGLSEQFESDGSLRTTNQGGIYSSFSRRSLMTFVIIEIIQQAKAQINSCEFRTKHGDIDIIRHLDKIIITCPTAMSKAEQIALRKCAEEAYVAVQRCKDPSMYYEPYVEQQWQGKIQIIPSTKKLSSGGNHLMPGLQTSHDWGYDEASCCQFVYLYAELTRRYMNHCDDFFNLYGHRRKAFQDEGYTKNSLTVGSIDMGAGTTDLMICSYKYDSNTTTTRLTPVPLFWDSFYYAGDDVLEEIIRQTVIEGDSCESGKGLVGPIFNAVCNAYMSLPDEEFLDALNVRDKVVLEPEMDEYERERIKYSVASRATSERIHNFFGKDKALMDFKDRLMRQDFNIQISVPMGLKYLELLGHGRKRTVLHYDDFFQDLNPAEFILEHFRNHFSLVSGGRRYLDIDFRDIEWVFDPQKLSDIIVPKLEPLIRQLAIVLHVYQCDIVLLAGKPMSLTQVTDMFLKMYPINPSRLIRLNDYRVGEWYPFADGLGYFKDQKSLVAVGAMIGYMAANGGLNGFHMDVSMLRKEMVSTSDYIGVYNSINRSVVEELISPDSNTATFDVHGFPVYLGCKQLPTRFYQARPLYAITLNPGCDVSAITFPVKLTVSRNYASDKEQLKLISAIDSMGRPLSSSKIRFNVQSLADEGTYWLDRGEFVLSING